MRAPRAQRPAGAEGEGWSYALCGHNAVLWARATEGERREVVKAFATNTKVTTVAMVNAYVNDAWYLTAGYRRRHLIRSRRSCWALSSSPPWCTARTA